jgi:beta-galactosidase
MKKKYLLLFIVQLCFCATSFAQYPKMDKLLYGVAYYDEYMPYERLDKDVKMMKEAGINVVRIAESTWSTVEPQDGVFDFTHIDRMLAAMQKGGIKVIVGTPTYAIPTWMARKHPEILAITPQGQNHYGVRQNMDITNTDFRMYAERVIRKIMEHVKDNPRLLVTRLITKPNHTVHRAQMCRRCLLNICKPSTKHLIISTIFSVWITGATALTPGKIFHR